MSVAQKREVKAGNGRWGEAGWGLWKAFRAMRIAWAFLVKRERGLGQISEAPQCLEEEETAKEEKGGG